MPRILSAAQREGLSRGPLSVRTHGRTGSPEYIAWDGMIQRCSNPNNRRWKDYGGRGIKVCERWRRFENFFADMGERPEGKSLDRYPDNDGNYEPGNCRWATPKQQQNNTRAVRIIEHEGMRGTVTEMAIRNGIKPHTLTCRLLRGWGVEDALRGHRKRPARLATTGDDNGEGRPVKETCPDCIAEGF